MRMSLPASTRGSVSLDVSALGNHRHGQPATATRIVESEFLMDTSCMRLTARAKVVGNLS
jgi:hypothetical protein